MIRIPERTRSTIVQIGEDEIELVASGEVAPLLLDKRLMDIVKKSLEYWYRNRQNSKVPKNQTLETILCTEPETQIEVKEFCMGGGLQRTPNSSEDVLTLQEKMNELRLEMEHAKFMDDPTKRLKMQAMLQRAEEAIKIDPKLADETNPVNETIAGENDGTEKAEASRSTESGPSTLLDHLRRTSVAVAGGALTVAGAALIPCPIVPGCLVTYLGLLILSTEFESARNALDAMRDPIDRFLLGNSSDEDVSVSSPEASPVK